MHLVNCKWTLSINNVLTLECHQIDAARGVQKIPTLKFIYIHVVDCDVIVPCSASVHTYWPC